MLARLSCASSLPPTRRRREKVGVESEEARRSLPQRPPGAVWGAGQRSHLTAPSLRAGPCCRRMWEADGKAPPHLRTPPPLCGSRAEKKGAGQQVPGRRRVGCQPANGLTSSAGIELMRSCDRAAGRLTPPPCAYTWRWEHVCHPVSIEAARVCDTMRIHLGRRALSAGERACWQASGAQDASRFLGPGLGAYECLLPMGIGAGRGKQDLIFDCPQIKCFLCSHLPLVLPWDMTVPNWTV